MEYEILDDLKLPLGKVTPKAFLFYQKNGLLNPQNFNQSGVLEILVNKEIVKEWLAVLFKIMPEELDKCVERFMELDYEVIFKAHNDFFGRLWKPLIT